MESTWWLVLQARRDFRKVFTLLVLATSLHSVALGASLCEDLLPCVCAHLLLWKCKCYLSRILGSLYFLRTDHFILSRWDTWEEKLFHPNFDLPSPQPYGLEIHKFCRDINFWQPDTPKDMSSDSFLTRLWYESRRYILPHQWQSQQMLFAIVFATWPSQLFGSIPAFLTSPVNKWIWVLLSTASPQIASPKSPPSKNEGKVGSAFLGCIKRHTGKVSSIFKSAKKSNLLFSC